MYFLRLTEETTDEAYYVRMRFYLNIQETDFYGFHMISDFKGKLYVSTDHTLSNAVSLFITPSAMLL